jgi:hypothetical protein
MANLSPIQRYFDRYLELKSKLQLSDDSNELLNLIIYKPAELNNFFMAGLGLSTLLLRLGAVIQLSAKLNDGNQENDALFMKQVLDNLRETLPSDTNWKNLWIAAVTKESKWEAASITPKGGQSLLDRFVTFRNKFVHLFIQIKESDEIALRKGIQIFDEMTGLVQLFDDSEIRLTNNKFYFIQNNTTIELYPFVQKGEKDDLPYLFQGLYDNKKQAKLINTHFGNEEPQDSDINLEPSFKPLRDAIQGGAGQVFDFSERINYYRACFVGRDLEQNAILDWCKSETESNMLPIFSPAGMGKGALIANSIATLQEEKIPVLYQFCGSGMQNSLHATLYHFILQAKKNQWWSEEDETIKRKLNRLPSKYIDVIHLFQDLLTNHFKNPRSNTSNNLIIVIDALDEASVAYPSLYLSDWFKTYNDKDEPEEDWQSPDFVKWIFTYRKTEGEKGYNLPIYSNLEQISILQPLQGLSELAVDVALKPFNVSNDFKKEVINRGKILA